jgi:DNA polymerase-3 subunit gamma/tau
MLLQRSKNGRETACGSRHAEGCRCRSGGEGVYQALYRKWRPRTFDDVVGQEKVTETLKNQIVSGRLSHAYLFVGTRGTGKTSCAKILARAVNCENPVLGSPCNKCKSCLGIEDGSIMDVVELDAASNNGVDNVRALRDEAVYSPAIVKKRVYIIDEVHMLSTSAFNALLKILEEPPEHLIFVLATTELNKVPATILSRCQRYRFRRIGADVIADRLRYVAQQENMQLEHDAADLLASIADGSMRDGLSLLDQCSGTQPITVENVQFTIGLADKQSTANLLAAVCDADTERAILIFEECWRNGKSPAALLTELCALLRDVLLIKVAPGGGRELLSAGYDLRTLESFSSRMAGEEIVADIDSIMSRIGTLRDGRDPKISAELCIIGLCDPDLGEDLACLRARVANIEQVLENGAVSAPKETHSFITGDNPTEKFIGSGSYDEPPFDLPNREKEPQKDNYISKSENKDNDESNINDYAPPDDPGVQAPAANKSEGFDNDLWARLYAELKKILPPYHLAHLSDGSAEFSDGVLVIGVTSSFKKTQLEKPELQEQIRSAITSVLGTAVPLKIAERAAPGGSSDKLDELLKFGNVKCE